MLVRVVVNVNENVSEDGDGVWGVVMKVLLVVALVNVNASGYVKVEVEGRCLHPRTCYHHLRLPKALNSMTVVYEL